jgi:hypothetical protein
VIIDYKTGRVDSAIAGERLLRPTPIYGIGRKAQLAAVASPVCVGVNARSKVSLRRGFAKTAAFVESKLAGSTVSQGGRAWAAGAAGWSSGQISSPVSPRSIGRYTKACRTCDLASCAGLLKTAPIAGKREVS